MITREKARAIVAHSPEPCRALVKVLAWCGLRLAEALALRRSSVDLNAGLLTVSESLTDADGRLPFQTPKNHQRRTMAIDAGLQDVLRDQLDRDVPPAPDSLLFTGRTGQPLRTSSVYRYVWKPALAGAGLEGVTPHALRRSVRSCSWTNVTLKHYARSLDERGTRVAAATEILRGQ